MLKVTAVSKTVRTFGDLGILMFNNRYLLYNNVFLKLEEKRLKHRDKKEGMMMDAISAYFLVAKRKQSHYFFISGLSPLYRFSLPFCSHNTVLEREGNTISLKVTTPVPLPTQLFNPQHARNVSRVAVLDL